MNTLQLLKCINLDKNSLTFLELDPNIECWIDGGFHFLILKSLFLLNFCIWCVGWPLALYVYLKVKNVNAIDNLKKNFAVKKNRTLFFDANNSSSRKTAQILRTIVPKRMMSNNNLSRLNINENNFFKIENKKLCFEQDILKSSSKMHFDDLIQNISEKKIDLVSSSNKLLSKEISNKNFLFEQDSGSKIDSDHLMEGFIKKRIDLVSLPKKICSQENSGSSSPQSLDMNIRKQPIFQLEKKDSILLNSKQKDQIFQTNNLSKFLTIDYKPDFYYWEGFFYISNLTIATLNVTTSRLDSNSQGGIFICIYFLMLMINELFQPFRHKMVNDFASFSYLTIIITIGFVLMSLTSKNSSFQMNLYLISEIL